jgi:hypothetical protein
MNTPVYSLRLPLGLRRALDLIASRDRRSTSNLMTLLLEAAVREAGLDMCPDCNATGTDPASNGHRLQCETCEGHGFVVHRPESSNRDKPSHAN